MAVVMSVFSQHALVQLVERRRDEQARRMTLRRAGVVHAWVTQIVLNCNEFKTIFFAPPCVAAEYIAAAPVGHGRPSAAQ